jgi:hypothetical protein
MNPVGFAFPVGFSRVIPRRAGVWNRLRVHDASGADASPVIRLARRPCSRCTVPRRGTSMQQANQSSGSPKAVRVRTATMGR